MAATIKCLVTGGAGFIGSHLVDRLLEDGHRVVVSDNLSTGRVQNLDHQKGHPKLELIEVDITDHQAIRPLFSGVDWVFHLAALADIVPSVEQPMDYHHSNVDGTVSVLEAARAAGERGLVHDTRPAAILFADLDALCTLASATWYRHALGAGFTEENLAPQS